MRTLTLHWRAFLVHSFVALGGLWTLLELFLAITGVSTQKRGLVVLLGVMLLALVLGVYLTLRSISGADFRLRGVNTRVRITFGDLFDRETPLVVPVNAYFDHAVQTSPGQPMPVSRNSVHGQLVERVGANEFRRRVDASLASVEPLAEHPDRAVSPSREYRLGTVARITHEERVYFLVATTTTDNATWAARGRLTDTLAALTEGWIRIAAMSDGAALAMPLFGSGFGKVRIDEEHLLDILIASLVEVSFQEGRIAPEIEIVLPERLRGEIRCYNVKAEWS